MHSEWMQIKATALLDLYNAKEERPHSGSVCSISHLLDIDLTNNTL